MTIHDGLKSPQCIWKHQKRVLVDQKESVRGERPGNKDCHRARPWQGLSICWGWSHLQGTFHTILWLIETKAMGNRPSPQSSCPRAPSLSSPPSIWQPSPTLLFSAAYQSFHLLGTKSESHPRLLCFSLTHSPPNHFYCHTAPKLTATPSSILLSSIPS
jgi:hypothetical protein